MKREPIPGDFHFRFYPGGPLSEAIAHITHAKISHVETIIDVGISGTLQVISAEKEGLVERWVIPENIPWSAILSCDDFTLKQRDALCQWMWDKRGTPYDIWGLVSFIVNIDLNDERKSFCSEVLYQGTLESTEIELLTGVDHAFVSPRDLWISPILKTINGLPKEIR